MWSWGWLFSNNDEESLNDDIITEEDFYEEQNSESETKSELPHDYDEFDWYNPADWFGNYDKSLNNYYDRKSDEKATQNRIFFYIVAGLFGIYLIRR